MRIVQIKHLITVAYNKINYFMFLSCEIKIGAILSFLDLPH
jgi:hypothetical protein